MGEPSTDAISTLIRQGAYAEAVEATAKALGGELGRFCMASLGDQEQAADVLGELLVAFHDAMPNLGHVSLRAHLYASALTLCRRRKAASSNGARATAGDDERSPHATRATLARLDTLERELLLLRYVASLDYVEIADVLELDVGEVTRLVGRGLLRLRQARQTETQGEDDA